MENKSTFFARLEPVLPPSSIRFIKTAYIFSKFGHRAQSRKELDTEGNIVRYFEHPRRVALICIDEAKLFQPEAIQACLLHDTLEDTEDMDPEIIEHTFGPKVCSYVLGLTKNKGVPYIEQLKSSPYEEIVLVKMFDRLDNLRSLDNPGCSLDFKNKQIKETNEKYYDIFVSAVQNANKSIKPNLMKVLQEIKTIIS